MSTRTREIHLVGRPVGRPAPSNFRCVEVDLPDPGPDEVLVRNLAMSVDPYMRPRMDDVPSYVLPYRLGAPLDGSAVGEVTSSRSATVPPGTLVVHGLGWREHALVPVTQLRIPPQDQAIPPSYHLGLLGGPGLTAYAGLREVTALRERDAVYVSAAAGAVGSLVGQFARLLGASRVIGSAGSPAKVHHLIDHLGFDGAFDYHDGVPPSLQRLFPDGIDVYFDNVGGDHLAAALEAMRLGGRVAMCGSISTYNSDRSAPMFRGDLFQVIARRLTLRGFISTDHAGLRPEFEESVRRWLAEGELVYEETVEHGLRNAPRAFMNMMNGANVGKMIVDLTSERA